MSELVGLLFSSVASDDLKTAQSCLDRCPLDELDEMEFMLLLSQLLGECVTYGRREMAVIIIEAFTAANASEEQLPLFTSLFMSYLFTDDILGFLIPLFPDTTFYEHITNLIEYDAAPMVISGAWRISKLYLQYDLDSLDDLMVLAEDYENVPMQEFLAELIMDKSPSAPKPEWMVNTYVVQPGQVVDRLEPSEPGLEVSFSLYVPYADELPLPDVDHYSFPVPDMDAAVDLLTEGLEGHGISMAELPEGNEDDEIVLEGTDEDRAAQRRALRSLLTVLPQEDLSVLVKPAMINITREQLDTHEELYRLLGPSNATYNSDLTRNDICCQYGGCRMFTCVEFEAMDEEDDSLDTQADWFTGNCDYCLLKIDNRFWAVREPLANGGWKGCFDNWDCVSKYVAERGNNKLLQAMINEVRDEMNRIGIQDRRERPRSQVASQLVPTLDAIGLTIQADNGLELDLYPRSLPESTASKSVDEQNNLIRELLEVAQPEPETGAEVVQLGNVEEESGHEAGLHYGGEEEDYFPGE